MEVESWLETAEQDLKSAEVLYKERIFPNSVFALQQSVEKSYKYFLFLLGLTEKELKDNIKHDTDKVLPVLIEKNSEKFDKFERNKDILESFGDKLESIVEELSKKIAPPADFKPLWTEEKLDLTKYIKNLVNTNKNKTKLICGIHDIESKINSNANKFEEVITELEELDSGTAKIAKLVDIIFNDENGPAVLDFLPTIIEGVKEIIQNKPQYKDLEMPKKEHLLKALPYLRLAFKLQILLSVAQAKLFLLSLLVHGHEEQSRYGKVKDNTSPKDIYTKDSVIIKRMPELLKTQNNLIDTLKTINQLKNDLAIPSR